MKRKVSKEEFNNFITGYPKPLEKDVYAVVDPPILSFNDFSDGKVWPESVVAFISLGADQYGRFATKEENDEYCIDEYYIYEK